MSEKDLDTRKEGPFNPYGHQEERLKLLAEPFDPKEVDFRIGQAGAKEGKPWAKVLAYIDARAVMDRLDEVVGPGNWKDRYWEVKGGEMCGLSIRINGEWVEKIDGSEETDIEAFKGAISKAMVRAAVKWGIGRYLYRLGDGWAQIVPSGTKEARWQPAKTGDKPYPAFYWLPPELPEWALPKKKSVQEMFDKPNAVAPSGTMNLSQKTAATQAAMREKLNGKQEAGIPKISAAQAGTPKTLEQSTAEFFEAACGPSLKGEAPRGPGPAASAGAVGPSPGQPALQDRVQPGGPGKGIAQEHGIAVAEAGAATSAIASGNAVQGIRHAGDATIGNHALASGAPLSAQGPASAGRDLPDGAPGEQRRAIPIGAIEATPARSEGEAAKRPARKSAVIKAVPRNDEEIAWFVDHMLGSLEEVKSMTQLSELWLANALAIKSLAPHLQSKLIRTKDEAKNRLKKV